MYTLYCTHVTSHETHTRPLLTALTKRHPNIWWVPAWTPKHLFFEGLLGIFLGSSHTFKLSFGVIGCLVLQLTNPFIEGSFNYNLPILQNNIICTTMTPPNPAVTQMPLTFSCEAWDNVTLSSIFLFFLSNGKVQAEACFIRMAAMMRIKDPENSSGSWNNAYLNVDSIASPILTANVPGKQHMIETKKVGRRKPPPMAVHVSFREGAPLKFNMVYLKLRDKYKKNWLHNLPNPWFFTTHNKPLWKINPFFSGRPQF